MANLQDITNRSEVGTIKPWGKATAPAGYVLCDGAAISRTDYAGFSFMDEYSIKKSCEKLGNKINLNLDLFKKHSGFSLTKSIPNLA